MNKLLCIGLLFCSLTASAQDIMTHTVKSGETITSICEQYGITKEELTSLNPSAKNYIYSGQVLNIPKRAQDESHAIYSNETTTGTSNPREKATHNETETFQVVEVPKATVMSNNFYQQSTLKKNKYSSENLYVPGTKIMFCGSEYVGVFCKPKDFKPHYLGISAGLGPGFRTNLSESLFAQWAFHMGMDDIFTYSKKITEIDGDDYTAISRTNNMCGHISVPVHLGIDLDGFSIRAGVFGKYTYAGYYSSTDKQSYRGKEDEQVSGMSYKEMGDIKRLSYGLSFDITFSTVYNRDKGFGFRVEKTNGSKESQKLIYFICYLYPD